MIIAMAVLLFIVFVLVFVKSKTDDYYYEWKNPFWFTQCVNIALWTTVTWFVILVGIFLIQLE